MNLRSSCHPEANGRKPQIGDVAWTLRLTLENGEPLELHIGKKGRDTLFGMMIADCHDSGEEEPYIPEGYHVQEDADGERLVKKDAPRPTDTVSPYSERIDELLAEMPKGRECQKCGGMMAHSRLRGWHCLRECR